VGSVVLVRVGDRQFQVVEVDGKRLESPPTVEVFPVQDGFAPSSVFC
jgi:hypothetical protein